MLTYYHGLLTLGIDVTTFPHLPYLHRSPRGSLSAKSSHFDHPFKNTFPPFRVGAFHRPQGKEQVKATLSKPNNAAGGYDLVVVALGEETLNSKHNQMLASAPSDLKVACVVSADAPRPTWRLWLPTFCKMGFVREMHTR